MSKLKRSPLDIEAIRNVTNLAEEYLRYREMLDEAAERIRKLEVRISKYADAIEQQDEASTRILNMYDKLTLSLSLLLGNDNKLSITKALDDGVDPSTVVDMIRAQIKRITQKAHGINPDIDEDIDPVQHIAGLNSKIIDALEGIWGKEQTQIFINELNEGKAFTETTIFEKNAQKDQESAKITIMLGVLVGTDAVNQFLKEIRRGVFVPETTLWKQNNEA